MVEQEENWITLVDEEGYEHRFNLLDVLEVDGVKYAVLLPEMAQEEEGEEEAVIFRVETNEAGEEVLADIEEDEEFDRVCRILEETYEEDEAETDEQ